MLKRSILNQRRSSISYVVGFRAKTCQARASALASQVIEAAFGANLFESWPGFSQDGSSSKTSAAARSCGSIGSSEIWKSKATRAYRSLLRRVRSALVTDGAAFSLSDTLPTLTNGRNALSPDSQKWPGHRRLTALVEAGQLLPTLTAERYGTRNNGNPNANGNDTRTEFATKGSLSLNSLAGAPLNPQWCEHFMGFPSGWTETPTGGKPSETRLSRNRLKLLGIYFFSSKRRSRFQKKK